MTAVHCVERPRRLAPAVVADYTDVVDSDDDDADCIDDDITDGNVGATRDGDDSADAPPGETGDNGERKFTEIDDNQTARTTRRWW